MEYTLMVMLNYFDSSMAGADGWYSTDQLNKSAPGGVYCSVETAALIVPRPFGNKVFVKQALPRSLFVELVCESARLPQRALTGIECFSADTGMVPAFDSKFFQLGFRVVNWPSDIIGRFVALPQESGRSNIEVGSAIITPTDTELRVRLNNLTGSPFFVKMNQLICHLIFEKYINVQVLEMVPSRADVSDSAQLRAVEVQLQQVDLNK
jgi:hypothetical protein